MPQKKTKEAKPRAARRENRPSVTISYGLATCLFCKKTFMKRRPHAKYDTQYCRMMHWHVTNKKTGSTGTIVEVDGVAMEKPVIDVKLEIESEVNRRMAKNDFERQMAELEDKKRALEEDFRRKMGGGNGTTPT